MTLEALDEEGIAVDSIADGLPTSLAELRDPAARIDWDVYAELLERIEQLCGDRLPPEEIGARIVRVPSFDLMKRAAQLLVSPRQLHEFGTRLFAPSFFPNVVVRNEWLPSGRVVVTGELMPGYRESKAFFRMCHGNVAAAPELLDLPRATIEEQMVTGRMGRMVLLLPPSHTLAARIARGLRAIGSTAEVFRGVARQQRELEASIAALRTSRHELQLLIERLPDGVLIQRDGVVRWANTALLEMLGRERSDVVGRSVLDLVPPEEREALAVAMRRAAPSEVTDRRIEYRVLRPDGTHRRVQAGTAQIVDFEGAKARLTILRDLTEHHRLREHAAIADRLASIGALAAGVAHEINNPLAYVRLSLEHAKRELHANRSTRRPELAVSLDHALEGTERVLAIVRDLKILSRIHDEPVEAVELRELLESTLALAAPAIHACAKLERSYAPTPRALAPRGRLGQVFLNLLTNATDAIPEGAAAQHTIRIATRTDALGRAVVEVADTGVGIAPHVAPRVFDPFFTTKAPGKGTGLGLAMCHRIVTELGGEISFDSREGSTRFTVALPAAEERALRTDETSQPPTSRTRGRILIVDDERALLVSLERLLGIHHEVLTATGVRDALAILRERRVDAVLADVMMPELNGVDLYESIRELVPGLEQRVVFMTGGIASPSVARLLAAIPNRCLEKPFAQGELISVLDELVLAAAS